MIVVPLIAGAWGLAIFFGIANVVVLAIRIRVEERAISERRA
jgi:isoprenylcysteine carboxyl methyltransferase (ICMT) family protein YpbQ